MEVCTTKWIRVLLMWIVSVAVLMLAYFTVVLPIHLAVTRKKAEAENMSWVVERVRDHVSVKNYERLVEEGYALAERLEGFVSGSSMTGESTYVISDIAGRTVALDFTTKQKTAKALSEIQNCQLLEAAHVEVSCKGSYLKFMRLVNEYERSRPVVLIDGFTVIVTDGGESDIKMSLLVLVGK